MNDVSITIKASQLEAFLAWAMEKDLGSETFHRWFTEQFAILQSLTVQEPLVAEPTFRIE